MCRYCPECYPKKDMLDRVLLALGDGEALLWFYSGPTLGELQSLYVAERIPYPDEDAPNSLVLVWEGVAQEPVEQGPFDFTEGGWRRPTPDEAAAILQGRAPWSDAKWAGTEASLS